MLKAIIRPRQDPMVVMLREDVPYRVGFHDHKY